MFVIFDGVAITYGTFAITMNTTTSYYL